MNSLRGSTSSPMRLENASSAARASSIVTCSSVRRAGSIVVSHTWANELTLLSDRLVTDLQQRVGKRSVRSIRFTVSRKVAEEHRWRQERTDMEETYSADIVQPVPVTSNESVS